MKFWDGILEWLGINDRAACTDGKAEPPHCASAMRREEGRRNAQGKQGLRDKADA